MLIRFPHARDGRMGAVCGVLLACLFAATASVVRAEPPARYTNHNIATAVHERPASFSRNKDGEIVGVTESGRTFSQTNVTLDRSIRLQRFSIDEAFWYISDRGVIWAKNDLAALSIYVSRA